MKEELQGKLVEILTSIQTAAGKASDFALGQLPDIAQSYVAYGRAVAIVGVVGGLLLALAGCFSIRMSYRESTKSYAQQHDGIIIGGGILGIAAAMLGVISVATNTPDLLMVWLAPKVWLLRELAHMVK